MKLYTLEPSEFHKNYIIKDYDLEFDAKFRNTNSLENNWGKLELEKAGGGKKSKVIFCFAPEGILIEKDMLPIFEKQFENDNVEFLPLYDGENDWYILHCCELADVKYTIDKTLLLNKYYLDEKEFVENNYDKKNVFKLLGRGVKDVIYCDLYTEKMVEFISGIENVGIYFKEAGAVVEEPIINNINHIVDILLTQAIRITEKIEEKYTIDYASINYFYDSEALDIGITVIFSDETGNPDKCYYSLIDDKLASKVKTFLNNGSSLEEIVDKLFTTYKMRISRSTNFEVELDEVD